MPNEHKMSSDHCIVVQNFHDNSDFILDMRSPFLPFKPLTRVVKLL